MSTAAPLQEDEYATDLLLLRRQVELEQKLVTLEKQNQISFFVPHARQELFYAAAGNHFRYARTGNRFGKSEMGAAEDISFALGYRPWYPEGHPLRTLGIPKHPTKGLIITVDWDLSKDVFTELEGEKLGKLFRYIPTSALGRPTKNHSGAIDRIPVRHISDGWSMIHLDTVKSYKQNPLGQESKDWDWIHIDEPIPEGQWKAVSRGLIDREGRAWFTCTPIAEPWIDRKFVPKDDDEESIITDKRFEHSDILSSTWMMTGSMDDNPHVSPAARDRFLADLTEEEREARRHGYPLHLSGLIYKEFDYALHVRKEPPPGWTDWDTPPPDYCLRFAIDYHFRKPNAILFIATSPQGRHYIYKDIWKTSLLADEVKEIRDHFANRSFLPGLVDPLASTPNKVTEVNAMDEYRRLGLPVLPATKDPVNGIRAVKAQLKFRDPKHGQPGIIFNKACRRTIFEISQGYIWDEDQDKPLKENDDMMENLYRLCLHGLPYIEPPDEADFIPPPISSRDDFSFDLSPILFDEPSNSSRRSRASRYR